MYNPFRMTRDDVLASLGLQTRRSAASYLVLPLCMLGVGIVTGAGLGLLFAPRTGRETREQLGHRASDVAGKLRAKMRRGTQELASELEQTSGFADAPGIGGNGRARMTPS